MQVGLKVFAVALVAAAMASNPARSAAKTPVAVPLDHGGRAPDVHCKWVSSIGRRMQLACPTTGGTWTYPYVSQDFDEYTLGKAEAGEPRSMTLMGLFYLTAPAGVCDYAAAMIWFRKAADKGDPNAMFGIGAMYQRGDGVAKDPAKSAQWILKAAQGGNVPAMFAIATYYEHGYGVAQNDAEASRWYRICADKGDQGCMGALSIRYHFGRGLPKDEAKSDYWQQRQKAADDSFLRSLP